MEVEFTTCLVLGTNGLPRGHSIYSTFMMISGSVPSLAMNEIHLASTLNTKGFCLTEVFCLYKWWACLSTTSMPILLTSRAK